MLEDARRRTRSVLMGAVTLMTVAAIGTACSSSSSNSATPTVEASPTATTTSTATATETQPAALDAGHIFGADLAGYEFVKLPKSLERQARNGFYQSSGLSKDAATVDMRSVTKDGESVGVLLVVALSPEMAALPGTTAKSFATGIGQSSNSKPKKVDLGATDGYVVDNGGQIYVAWKDQNLLISHIGEAEAPSVAAARAVVRATAE